MLKKNEWKKLYEIAKEIQELKPWKKLWDTDLCMFIDKDTKKEYYFCTMGHNKAFKGVSIYTKEQFVSYYHLAKNPIMTSLGINYQNCINCAFLPKEEMLPCNLKLLTKLDISFDKEWIGFEFFEKGYEPYSLTMDQVEMLLNVLPHYIELVKEYMKKNIKASFLDSLIYTRSFNEEKGEYQNQVKELEPLVVNKEIVSYKDFLSKEIKNLQKRNDMTLEIEFLNHLPVLIEDMREKIGRSRYPLLKMVAEQTTGLILYMQLDDKIKYSKEAEYVKSFLLELVNLLKDIGIPQKILVRDEESYSWLLEFCQLLPCSLEISEKLPVIDMTTNNFFSDL